jgi:hypothetical protein
MAKSIYIRVHNPLPLALWLNDTNAKSYVLSYLQACNNSVAADYLAGLSFTVSLCVDPPVPFHCHDIRLSGLDAPVIHRLFPAFSVLADLLSKPSVTDCSPAIWYESVKQLRSTSSIPSRASASSMSNCLPTSSASLPRPASRPASPPASRSASRSASPPASRPASPPASRFASPPASRPASPQASRSASPPASRPASPPASRPASPPASRSASPRASRPASPVASRSASPLTSRSASLPFTLVTRSGGHRPVSSVSSSVLACPNRFDALNDDANLSAVSMRSPLRLTNKLL